MKDSQGKNTNNDNTKQQDSRKVIAQGQIQLGDDAPTSGTSSTSDAPTSGTSSTSNAPGLGNTLQQGQSSLGQNNQQNPSNNSGQVRKMQNNSFGNNRSSFSNSSRFNSPSNNSFGSSGSRFGSPGGGNSNLSKEEKVEIIKKAYEEVLDREATRRDINFYKYSQIDEESMKIKLIKTKEHKDLIKLGRKYKQLKEEYDNTLGQLKMYQSKMKDHSEVIREMQTVLDEKNGYITELRRELRNYKSATGGFDSQDPNSRAMTINAYSDADGTQDRVNNQRKTENKYEESASLMDELRNFIKSLFDF